MSGLTPTDPDLPDDPEGVRELLDLTRELFVACKAALGELTEGPCDIDACSHEHCATAKLRAAIANAEDDTGAGLWLE